EIIETLGDLRIALDDLHMAHQLLVEIMLFQRNYLGLRPFQHAYPHSPSISCYLSNASSACCLIGKYRVGHGKRSFPKARLRPRQPNLLGATPVSAPGEPRKCCIIPSARPARHAILICPDALGQSSESGV